MAGKRTSNQICLPLALYLCTGLGHSIHYRVGMETPKKSPHQLARRYENSSIQGFSKGRIWYRRK